MRSSLRRGVVSAALFLGACAGSDNVVAVVPPPPPAPLLPPPPPAPVPRTVRLEIGPSGADAIGLFFGGFLQLAPRVVVSTGDTLAPSAPVSFSSRVPANLSVDASGGLTAREVGMSTILASTVYEAQTLVDTLFVIVTCTSELRSTVTPADTVLAVGQGFTPTILLTTCQGRKTITSPITWTAVDPTVVSVNQNTGETVALRPGTTIVRAWASINPSSPTPVAGIPVKVQ